MLSHAMRISFPNSLLSGLPITAMAHTFTKGPRTFQKSGAISPFIYSPFIIPVLQTVHDFNNGQMLNQQKAVQ